MSDPTAGAQPTAQGQAGAAAAKPTDSRQTTAPATQAAADPAAPGGGSGKPQGEQPAMAGQLAAAAVARQALPALAGGKKAMPQVAWPHAATQALGAPQRAGIAKGASPQTPTVATSATAAAGQPVAVPQTPAQGALHRAIYASSSGQAGEGMPTQPVESRPGKAVAETATAANPADALLRAQTQAPQGMAQADAALAAGRADRPALADQIAQTVAANNLHGTRQITIQLSPPELGRVRLSLEADGDHVRGVLEVQNPRALAELRQETANLAQRLAESGVDLKRLDVQLAPPAREGSMGSSLPQNSDGGQGGQSGHGGQAGQGGQQWAGRDGADRGGGWQTGNSHSPGTYDRGTQRNEQSDLQAEVADESINVWM